MQSNCSLPTSLVICSLCGQTSHSLLTACFPQELSHAAPVVKELARRVAAAVYTKQIPLQDLQGVPELAVAEPHTRDAALQTEFAQAFARLIIETYIDADGMS